MMHLSAWTPFQFVFFLGLIQTIVASIRWRSPQYRSNNMNFQSDTYFCNNGDKVNNNQPYEPKKIFWVHNKAYEVEMDFSKDAGSRQNYSMKMWRVIWRQNKTNLTQILSPEVKEILNVYGPTQMTSAERGILKLSNTPITKLNISIEKRLVCRPEEFACALVIEQNRTGNEGKAWRSCTDVLILSEDNNVTLSMTMNVPPGVVPLLVSNLKVRMHQHFGNKGFTEENVYQVFPPNGIEKFNVVNNKYSVTYQIKDMKGFNSETVASNIKNTLLVTDKGKLDGADVASIDITIGTRSSATYLQGGMGVTVAIVFVLLNSLCA